jgi:8-oxo-dGTP pyrophosphatase MutT (NUDIX family)
MTILSPRPAAAVIFLRDGAQALEVLLVRRNEAMAVHGGSWVFPGGKVDPADAPNRSSDELAMAGGAAVREVWEETGVCISREELHPFSHWTTSLARPKRFSTWFFLASLQAETPIRVDGTEIVDHRWMTPENVLASRHSGKIVLPAPTFICMEILRTIGNVDALPAFLANHVVERFNPKIVDVPEGEVALYDGDSGYEAQALELPGPRHRLHMLQSGWSYRRDATNKEGAR